MKNLLLATLLFPVFSAPLPWSEMELGDQLTLTENVNLGESGHSFPAGTALRLTSIEPLAIAGAPVMYLAFTQAPCANPEWESGIEIVVPRGNSESSSVGVEISPNCHWGVYVEQKDLFNPSFFGRASVPAGRHAHTGLM